MRDFDRLIEQITTYSLTLFGIAIAGSAFIYSVIAQLFRSGLSISAWLLLVHVTILAGLFFLLSFGVGFVSRYSRFKVALQTVCLFLFSVGFIFAFAVSILLYLESFPS